jgi:2-methylfumaryl-CoA hydratase
MIAREGAESMTEHDAAVIETGGPWFEDFTPGLQFDAPAVTLTAGHATVYQALFGDRLRLPLDHAASRVVTGRPEPLAHPMLPIHVAIGQSTWASQRVKANLFYRGLTLLAPVHLGDTLTTRTTVVGLRQNRPQPGRPATGVVALEIRTHNQHGEPVLHFWRAPMIPCRDAQARTGHQDALDALGAGAPAAPDLPLPAWSPADASAGWLGPRAEQLQPGMRWRVEARDTVTSAPELVRLTLNMAMAHTDARLSYLPERLVYGGHTISTAFAQLTRVLPNLLTLLAWESCDHTAPVLENDRLRTEVTLLEKRPVAGGALLRLHVEAWAARGEPEQESRVLDWKLVAWSA